MQKLKNKKIFKSNKRRKLKKEEKIKSWNQNLKKKKQRFREEYTNKNSKRT